MGKTLIEPKASPYYPPRARWYGGIFYLSFAVRRALHLERIQLPGGLSTLQLLLSLTVPGFAFHALGRRILGIIFQAVYGVSVLGFVGLLGYPLANICFGLMISVHATSIVYLEGHWLRDGSRFGYRLALAILTLIVVWLLVYLPLLNLVERHWIIPLRIAERVVVVSRSVNPESLKHGDWVAFRVSGPGGQGFYVRAGFALGPVLAVGGDRVEFGKNSFKVNGVPQPSLRFMPVTGEVVMPEKHWFLWPEYTISGGGENAPNVTGYMVQMATVSPEQFVGKPFKRWFWRRQVLQPAAAGQTNSPQPSPRRVERP